jgi:hypothetical protein
LRNEPNFSARPGPRLEANWRTDGALTANTCKDRLLGAGTYVSDPNVRIDIMTDGLTAFP